jgi:hypothetical protein
VTIPAVAPLNICWVEIHWFAFPCWVVWTLQ